MGLHLPFEICVLEMNFNQARFGQCITLST